MNKISFNKHRIRRNRIYRTYMRCKAILATIRYGFPSRHLVCYSVTGTDGKSTTSEMLYHLMKQAGFKVGMISTVSIDVGVGKVSNETKLTSLGHAEFQRLLAEAVNNNLTHMVIESSSHALYQSRLWPIRFAGVGWTNLTREHLDFHWTMEHYFATKMMLFRSYVAKDSIGIIPFNFSWKQEVQKLSKVKELLTFGYSDEADIYVTHIKESPMLSFKLHYQGAQIDAHSRIVGSFNVENMMIASVLAHHAGLLTNQIKQGLESFPGVAGRQEIVQSASGKTVMIDFALTPDALETLYKAVRGMGFEKIIAVFGATGDRDQGKRPLMGEVATRLCDFVVLTEDENYHEDGMSIIKDIQKGISKEIDEKNYVIIQDREKAIQHAISVAGIQDIVIVTGMGNFTSRAMNTGKISWNEREIIEKILTQ